MFFGIGSGKLHTGRRVQLVIWLQILQEWIGIAGITIYGPEIFTIAGISAKDRLWVSGINNITYMVRLANTSSPQRFHHTNTGAVRHTDLRLHHRSHRSPLDSVLGSCRPGHLHVRRRWPRSRNHQCLRQSKPEPHRRRCNILCVPLHCHFRRYLADGSLVVSGRDFPSAG
jgi:hypothetical protein